MTFERFDVVVVPFPYTDRNASKRRPAVIISGWDDYGRVLQQSVMVMITSAAGSTWPFDLPLSGLSTAGLVKNCVIRLKIFTLDHKLIDKRIGALVQSDVDALRIMLGKMLALPSASEARSESQ